MAGHRLLTAVVAGLVASAAQVANAADLEPAPVVAPSYSWTGCYVGVQAGFGGLQDGFTAAVNPNLVNPVTGAVTSGVANQWGFGVLGGAQGGCNYQIGLFVVGLESDAWGSSLGTESDYVTSLVAQKASATNPWDFDLAARVGVAYDGLLFYGKAGGVWGSFNYNYTSLSAAQAGTAISPGVLLGFGIEYAIWRQWTVRTEADFLLFSAANVTLGCTGCFPGPAAYTTSISNSELLLKIGANYKF